MRISNRGGRGVLPLILILLVLGTSLFANGSGVSDNGYDPKAELERASSLIEEGRLDDAIGVLVEIARKDPEQMERVQKIVREIREDESDIAVLFTEIRDVINRDDLSPDEKLVLIEENINAIKVIDSDPTSDTWVKLSFVESELLQSLDELRRESFFLKGNEQLALGQYRNAVEEYRKGFIDSSFGESQTYEKYRDAVSADEIDRYATVPERQKVVLDAYNNNAPDGDRIINELNSAIDNWDQLSSGFTDLGAEAVFLAANSAPGVWDDDLAAYINLLTQIDGEIRNIRNLDGNLNAVKLNLYEDLGGAPEEFRYDRIDTFLNGRDGREPEGIIISQDLQWEMSFLDVIYEMLERARLPYAVGRTQYLNSQWTPARDSFESSGLAAEAAEIFLEIASDHVESQRINGIIRFSDVYDPIFIQFQLIPRASEIRSDLADITEIQPRTDDASLSVLGLDEIQLLSARLQDSIDQITILSQLWDESFTVFSASEGFTDPDVQKIDTELQSDLSLILENLFELRVNVFILYMEPRYNILRDQTAEILSDSPDRQQSARSLIDEGRPGAALNGIITPALTSLEELKKATEDFLDTVDDVRASSAADQDDQKFLDFKNRAASLLVQSSEDIDKWENLRSDAVTRRNTALRALTIAVAGLDNAAQLVNQATQTAGADPYQAKNLYLSASAAVEEVVELVLLVEINDSDAAAESGIRQRLANLEAETLNAPRALASTVRDQALAEADEAILTDGDLPGARESLVGAQEFWVSIYGEDEIRLARKIAEIDRLIDQKKNTEINRFDPLFMEMNQYLNLANRYYNEGVSKLPSGTSNEMNPDALRSFRTAEDLLTQVTDVFPGNGAALILELKIQERTDPDAFNRRVNSLIRDAEDALAENRDEDLDELEKPGGLENQLQALYDFKPEYPGLKGILAQINDTLRPPPPEATIADIQGSRDITTNVQTIWNRLLDLGNEDIVISESPGLTGQLDTAITLWDKNRDAIELQDEIRNFVPNEPLSPDTLELVVRAEDAMNQNNVATAQIIYDAIITTDPGSRNHPRIVRIRKWLEDRQ